MPIESPSRPLTVAVVGATGLVGRTMIAILGERDFPVGELRPLASHDDGRSVEFGGRHWPVQVDHPGCLRGRRHRPLLGRRRRLQGLRPGGRGARRGRRRQLLAVAHGAGRAARGGRRQRRGCRRPRGHRRQPQLLHDAADAAARGPPRQRRHRARRRGHLPVRQRHRQQGRRGARAAGPGPRRGRAAGDVRLSPPDRLQRAAPHRCLPRGRLHQGGVEGHRRDRARSCTCRTCASRARPCACRW